MRASQGGGKGVAASAAFAIPERGERYYKIRHNKSISAHYDVEAVARLDEHFNHLLVVQVDDGLVVDLDNAVTLNHTSNMARRAGVDTHHASTRIVRSLVVQEAKANLLSGLLQTKQNCTQLKTLPRIT